MVLYKMSCESHHTAGGFSINLQELADTVLEVGDHSYHSHEDGQILVLPHAFVALVDSWRQQPVFGPGVSAFEEAGLACSRSCGLPKVSQVHYHHN
jgi:hypothetical protein